MRILVCRYRAWDFAAPVGIGTGYWGSKNGYDPLRSQRRAIAVGVLLSLLIAGGAVMLALLRPQPAVNEAALAQDEAGGLYVRLGRPFIR